MVSLAARCTKQAKNELQIGVRATRLTPAQIQALDKATAGKTDAISQTVQKAVSEEEKRRAEEQEKERRKRCQQAGKNDCV